MTLTPAQKKYLAIQNALRPAEKDLIKYYELQWMLRSHIPTPAEVTSYLRDKCKIKRPNIRETSVKYYLTRAPVRRALKERGIPFETYSQEELTGDQQAAALAVMNFADTRPVAEKLDQLGILPATYYGWLNDPNFRNFVQNLADQNLINVDPIAKTEFAKKVTEGEWNAIKFYMENTGVLKNNDTPQSEVVILKIVEILQKHIQDANILSAIANDMIAAFSNRTLSATPAHAIDAEFAEPDLVFDPELEDAKKKLGLG